MATSSKRMESSPADEATTPGVSLRIDDSATLSGHPEGNQQMGPISNS